MSAVVSAVSNVVESAVDVVGDVVDVAVDVVKDVGDAAVKTVETALDNPVATIATIAAIAAGQPQLIPAINAANTVAQGGDFDDALKSAAVSYVAQGAGQFVGDQLGTALEYGTDLGSAQTAQLAAQTGDMLAGTTSGTIGGAVGAATSGATAAALSGGDVDQAFINALGNYLTRTGVRYTMNEAGKLVDEFGNPAPEEAVNEILADAESELQTYSAPEPVPTVDPYEVDNIGNIPEENILGGLDTIPEYSNVVSNEDGTTTEKFDDGSTLTVDESGNVVSSTTVDGEVIYPSEPVYTAPTVDPYEVDNVGNIPEENILTGGLDPYEIDNIGNIPEENILAGDDTLSNIGDAAGKYLKNQFTNSLVNQITGNLGFNQPQYSTGTRRTGVNLPSLPGVGSLLTSLGFDPSQLPSTTAEDLTSNVRSGDLRLWDPGISDDWGPLTKIGGLGFAGKFLYPEDTQYVNQSSDDRDRMLEEIRSRGWVTDEERQALENESQFFDYGNEPEPVNATAGMSPWFAPGYAEGGLADHNPEFYSEGGASIAHRYVKGDGDGTSDSVPAMLASGEFVIPADVVSGLGNGDNDAGAKVLDEFMKSIRQHKRSADPSELPPDSKGALSYLSEAQKKVGKKHGRS